MCSLDGWLKLPEKTILVVTFFWREVFIYHPIIFNGYWAIPVFYFLLANFSNQKIQLQFKKISALYVVGFSLLFWILLIY